MNKILITGCAGYVGSALIKYIHCLNRSTDEILCVDPGLFGYKHIENFVLDKTRKFKLFDCSLESFIRQYSFEDIKTVLHLGGLSNDPMADFSPCANKALNLDLTVKLIKACTDAPREDRRFIFASSASVYGQYDLKLVTEKDFPKPNSAYAQCKWESEKEVLAEKNINSIVVRKGTIYGLSPRMRYDLVVNTMVANAVRFGKINLYGGGENWRPLISIEDVVNIYYQLIYCGDKDYKLHVGEIYNLSSGNYRISELGLRVGSILKVPVYADYDKPKDKRSYMMDSSKASKVFELEDTITRSVLGIHREIRDNKPDLDDPIYSNIAWLKNCARVADILKVKFDLCNL